MTDRDDFAEIERLLPFYVNGTLSSADRKRVEVALAGSAALRDALEEERQNQARLIAAVQTELATVEPTVEARNQGLHSQLNAQRASRSGSGSGGLIGALSFLNPKRWHPAVALSLAAALPLQGVVIASKNNTIGMLRDENFQLASGPCEDRPLAGAVQLELADEAKWAEVAALLDSENLTIAKSGNFGTLTVKTGKQGAELTALISRLKASPLVASVEPAA